MWSSLDAMLRTTPAHALREAPRPNMANIAYVTCIHGFNSGMRLRTVETCACWPTVNSLDGWVSTRLRATDASRVSLFPAHELL